ncbi:MAG: hypothetical protein HZC28_08310 [Spirochaetes bacterium]|nr:hypothetical protein [Spirochaetota bacterium]
MKQRIVLAAAFIAALGISCNVFQPPIAPYTYTGMPPFHFNATNFWYQKIATNAAIDTNSPAMVSNIVQNRPAYSPWGVPHTAICYADANTRRYNVPVNAVYPPHTGIRSVPIPEHMLPEKISDSHVAIVDTNGGFSYEFWNMRVLNGRWVSGNAAIFSLAGNGVNQFISARASGFSLLAGLIWPQEILSTNIQHALVISWQNTRKGGAVAPATYSDGWRDEPGAIPMGALIQLDPAFDITTISNADKYQLAIFRALQEYGGYICDTGGFSFYLVSLQSYAENPYSVIPSYSLENNSIDLSILPLERLRVIQMGPEREKTNGYAFPEMYY